MSDDFRNEETDGENEAIAAYLNTLSVECDERTIERHNMGAQQYGPTTFLTADTLEMAIEEILDMMNYMRYTYIKLRILQDKIANITAEENNGD